MIGRRAAVPPLRHPALADDRHPYPRFPDVSVLGSGGSHTWPRRVPLISSAVPARPRATASTGSRGWRRSDQFVLACLGKKPRSTVVERTVTSMSPARAETAFSVARSATPGSTSLCVNRVRKPSAFWPQRARAWERSCRQAMTTGPGCRPRRSWTPGRAAGRCEPPRPGRRTSGASKRFGTRRS